MCIQGGMQLSATAKSESGGLLRRDSSTKRVLVSKEEYISLRWAAAYWKAQHAGAVEREKQLKSENLSLRARVRELESQLWGARANRPRVGALAVPAPGRGGDPEGSKKAGGGTVGPLWTGCLPRKR